MSGFFSDDIDGPLPTAVVSGATTAISMLASGVQTAGGVLVDVVSSMASGISGVATAVISGISSFASGIMSGLTGALSGLVSGITGIATSIIGGIAQMVSSIAGALMNGLRALVDGLVSVLGMLLNGLQNAVKSMTDFAQSALTMKSNTGMSYEESGNTMMGLRAFGFSPQDTASMFGNDNMDPYLMSMRSGITGMPATGGAPMIVEMAKQVQKFQGQGGVMSIRHKQRIAYPRAVC